MIRSFPSCTTNIRVYVHSPFVVKEVVIVAISFLSFFAVCNSNLCIQLINRRSITSIQVFLIFQLTWVVKSNHEGDLCFITLLLTFWYRLHKLFLIIQKTFYTIPNKNVYQKVLQMLLQDVFEDIVCIKTCQCNDWHLTYLFIKCMTDLYFFHVFTTAHTARRRKKLHQ